MGFKQFTTCHLVKGQDLNHHGTLYAGRQAEWFVEAGFIAAASLTNPDHIVCFKIHGMTFKKPVKRGEIITYSSMIVLATRTKLVAYVRITNGHDQSVIVEGFITFVHVDSQGLPLPHGIENLTGDTFSEIELQEQAKKL